MGILVVTNQRFKDCILALRLTSTLSLCLSRSVFCRPR